MIYYRYLNDLFAYKKCRIFHIENLTNNKKKRVSSLKINILLYSNMLHVFLKYEITEVGSLM